MKATLFVAKRPVSDDCVALSDISWQSWNEPVGCLLKPVCLVVVNISPTVIVYLIMKCVYVAGIANYL